jgi:hypothetical protein
MESRPICQQIATITATEATFTASKKIEIDGEFRIFLLTDLTRLQIGMKV